DRELERLFEEHRTAPPGPPPSAVHEWVEELLGILFPPLARQRPASLDAFRGRWTRTNGRLAELLRALDGGLAADPRAIVSAFEQDVPRLREVLLEDADAIYAGDPAATDHGEVIRSYPGFLAIAIYRIAHFFHN